MEQKHVLTAIHNQEIGAVASPYLEERFFEDEWREIWKVYIDFYMQTSHPPTKDVYEVKIDDEDVLSAVEEIFGEQFDQYDIDFYIKEIEAWAKEKAVYLAIVDGIEEFEKEKKDFGRIVEELKEAVSFKFDSDIGVCYVDDADDRFDLYQAKDEKFSFGIQALDKLTDGGFERGTLNVVIAKSGGGKSIYLCDVAAKCMLNGMNVLYVSLEMSPKNILKRIDANLLSVPVWKVDKISRSEFQRRLDKIKKDAAGDIIVKQYPTRAASAMHIRHLIEEIKRKKGYIPDVVIVDYIGIMKAASGSNHSTYTELKQVAEELRGVAVEYNIPLFSAHQINRDGYKSSAVGMDSIADSMGIAHTSDFIFSLIRTEELDEENQAVFSIVKSRYGENNVSVNVGLDIKYMRFFDLDSSYGYGEQENADSGAENASDSISKFRKKEKRNKDKLRGLVVG